mgnify:CR=1 FL=1
MKGIVRRAALRSRANSEYYVQKETRMDIIHVKPKHKDVKQVLVHHKGDFYLVSENTTSRQTLIFPSSPTGEPESYLEVGGGSNTTLEEVLEDFEEYLIKRT